VVGEVGLGGEVRAVRGVSRRLGEAARLGFTRAVVPAGAATPTNGDPAPPAGLEIVEVKCVKDAIAATLSTEA
jgi:DNA repair protein RadA/Sms